MVEVDDRGRNRNDPTSAAHRVRLAPVPSDIASSALDEVAGQLPSGAHLFLDLVDHLTIDPSLLRAIARFLDQAAESGREVAVVADTPAVVAALGPECRARGVEIRPRLRAFCRPLRSAP